MTQTAEVIRDGETVGYVFGRGDAFSFVLTDSRDDKVRGGYETISDAMNACAHLAQAVQIADRWELMVDT